MNESHRTQSRLGLARVRMEGQKPLTREAAEAYASIGVPVVAWQDDLGATHYRLLPEHERQARKKARQTPKVAPQSTNAPVSESKSKPFAPTAAEAAQKQAIKRAAVRNGIFNLWTGH